MRILVILLGLISTPLWAADQATQSEYSKCILDGYYQKNDGANSCDFSNVRANLGSVARTCNMKLVKEIDLDNIASFTVMMDELESAAFGTLNKDLNSKLYGCGYMGEIELSASGGRIEIYEFTVSPESCGSIASLVESNNAEYVSASPERKDELRDQNLLLNKVAQRSNCDGVSPETTVNGSAR